MSLYQYLCIFFYLYDVHRDLHSFPHDALPILAKKLIASGKIPAGDSAVLCITGNGLKTLDAVVGHVGQPREIKPSRSEEHTSESSHANISYAVFCLKKKNKDIDDHLSTTA